MSASPNDVAYGYDVVPAAQWANITSLATFGSNIITNEVSNITFALAETSLINNIGGRTDYKEFETSTNVLFVNEQTLFLRSLNKVNIGIFEHTNLEIMRYTIIHELSHSIGLFNHTGTASDLLYYQGYNTNNASVFELSAHDITVLNAVYRRLV